MLLQHVHVATRASFQDKVRGLRVVDGGPHNLEGPSAKGHHRVLEAVRADGGAAAVLGPFDAGVEPHQVVHVPERPRLVLTASTTSVPTSPKKSNMSFTMASGRRKTHAEPGRCRRRRGGWEVVAEVAKELQFVRCGRCLPDLAFVLLLERSRLADFPRLSFRMLGGAKVLVTVEIPNKSLTIGWQGEKAFAADARFPSPATMAYPFGSPKAFVIDNHRRMRPPFEEWIPSIISPSRMPVMFVEATPMFLSNFSNSISLSMGWFERAWTLLTPSKASTHSSSVYVRHNSSIAFRPVIFFSMSGSVCV